MSVMLVFWVRLSDRYAQRWREEVKPQTLIRKERGLEGALGFACQIVIFCGWELLSDHKVDI